MMLLGRSSLVTCILIYRALASTAGETEIELDVQGNSIASDSSAPESHDDGDNNVECGLWLAPSTLKGAGLGMYAGIDFVKGEELLRGGDSVIAISDITQHNANKEFKGNFLWDEYTWNAEALKMKDEGFKEVNVASEGFGSAANSFLPIYNVDEWHPLLSGTGLHRSKDAGAGASTMFHHRKSTAKYDITAGSELYVSCTCPV
jgi:hypothetical protein